MSFSFAHPSLRRALAAKAYVEPTPVQAAVMAPEAEGRDLLVSAQTGSGKTVAFGLSLATPLLGDAERLPPAGAPRALIVAPTRELAIQVHRELSWLYAETGARITTCVGGMDPRRERDALSRGVHIVVGTPGRLCDHLDRGALVLARIEAIVLDEADEMLDMGFREDLERLRSIREQLTRVETKEFWEVIDRGRNFEYMPARQKAQMDTFFAMLPRPTPMPTSTRPPTA